MPGASETNTTLLLDLNTQMGEIRSQIGALMASFGHVSERQKEIATDIKGVEKRLEAGSVRHAEFAASLADIDVKIEEMRPAVSKLQVDILPVAGLAPQVKELMDWKARVAAQTLIAWAIVSAAFWLIWEGLRWFFPHAKDLVDKITH